MTQTTVGNLEVFDLKRHNSKYVKHVQLYFKANNITEDCKKAVFLSVLAYEMYEILANILTNLFTLNYQLLLKDITFDAFVRESQKA